MARALTAQRFVVPLGDRDKYLTRMRRRRDHYRSHNCRFWVFEEVDLHGAFMEFIEADDARTLIAALGAAPDKTIESLRVYEEMELD